MGLPSAFDPHEEDGVGLAHTQKALLKPRLVWLVDKSIELQARKSGFDSS